MDSLKTGDVILYSKPTGNWLSSITGMLTRTNRQKTEYIHCGMILKDPVFIHQSLKGLYVWQTKMLDTHNDDESDSSESDSDNDDSNTETIEETTNDVLENVSTVDNTTNLTEQTLEIEIVPLKQILDDSVIPNITCRRVICKSESFSTEKMRALHETVTETPKNIFPQEEIKGVLGHCDLSAYSWDASFIGYLYTKCDILSKETPWHLLRAQDFASNTENLRLNTDVSFDSQEFDLV